jgi:hypothetical protein
MDLYVKDKIIHFFKWKVSGFGELTLEQRDNFTGYFSGDDYFVAETDDMKNEITAKLDVLSKTYTVEDISPTAGQLAKKATLDGKVSTRTEALELIGG